jgi:hypothetical protein
MKPLVQSRNANLTICLFSLKLSSLWQNILKNMREYVRVPIPVPTGVILCAYKLGFGLVQNFLENFKIPSVWAHRTVRCAPDTAMCNVRCTGWAHIDLLLCYVVWCVPDMHCRLFGVPITHFFKKKILARAALRFPLSTRCSLSV